MIWIVELDKISGQCLFLGIFDSSKCFVFILIYLKYPFVESSIYLSMFCRRVQDSVRGTRCGRPSVEMLSHLAEGIKLDTQCELTLLGEYDGAVGNFGLSFFLVN